MVKRILCVLLLALLLPCAALANAMVVDDADLFTVFEIADMEQIIQRIEAEYQMDIVVLTTYDVPATYNDRFIQDYADIYYEQHGYGLGDDKAGLLYMIDMTNRSPCISTDGVMIDFITDDRLDTLLNVSNPHLAVGDYGKAAVALLNYLERFLAQGRLEGSFRYDAETGTRLSGLYNALTGTEMLIAVVAGLAVAGIMYATVSGRYNLKGSTYRYDRANNSSCDLTQNDETFLRESVSVIRHSTSNGGHSGGGGISSGRGSSVHRSSSGRSHGGGVGRRF
ncbi:MAG: TPM domain-containing protein [Clostridiales bacterium]|nr:TPM domain-containing protein [Clostridiales bacterium]